MESPQAQSRMAELYNNYINNGTKRKVILDNGTFFDKT